MEARVRSNLPQLVSWLQKMSTGQVPFATARALTWCAQAVQGATRTELHHEFTIRSGWVPGGILTKPAEKKDWPRPVAYVGSRDQFMVLQKTGGEKRATRSKDLAIIGKGTKRGAGGRIPSARKPRAVLADKRRVFIERRKRGEMIVQRMAGGHLKVLYLLRPRAHIKARFGIEATAQRVVGEMYPRFFQSSFQQAMAVPKPHLTTH